MAGVGGCGRWMGVFWGLDKVSCGVGGAGGAGGGAGVDMSIISPSNTSCPDGLPVYMVIALIVQYDSTLLTYGFYDTMHHELSSRDTNASSTWMKMIMYVHIATNIYVQMMSNKKPEIS